MILCTDGLPRHMYYRGSIHDVHVRLLYYGWLENFCWLNINLIICFRSWSCDIIKNSFFRFKWRVKDVIHSSVKTKFGYLSKKATVTVFFSRSFHLQVHQSTNFAQNWLLLLVRFMSEYNLKLAFLTTLHVRETSQTGDIVIQFLHWS